MSTLFACLKRDMSLGKPYAFFGCLSVSWVFITEYNGTKAMAPHSGPSTDCISLLSLAFSGIPPITPDQQFILPIGWTALMLALSLPACLFPARDLRRPLHAQILTKTSRGVWWLSKLIWSALSWSASFVALCGVVAAISVTSDPDAAAVLASYENSRIALVLYAALTSLCICLAACVCSLAFGSSAAACATAGFLVASSYCSHPILVANFAMIERTAMGAVAIPPLPAFVALALGILATISCLGLLSYRKTDVLTRR